ncbi:RagB/SusD family nutrient uptake outer membrane protein [Chondrinema litorale]|uniref:RagB/SusD family nutrient uptake outer membrane protein n=1 Tax=Chondrinema litorale TaxID=2994555 RepID=UPI002543989A|nr:RagB/SusD family nutrient uptake outer membrane protein [Chondrinema litorale]UZR99072.1 RagB/SusD family nutrient uptake outer membrane protein [Chondrinema litorale]
MNIKKLLIIGILVLSTLTQCEDVLETENIYSYDSELVWQSEDLANAYLANLYSIFGNWSASADNTSEQITGMPFYEGLVTVINGSYKNWDYSRIRLINQAIEDVNSGTLDQEIKDEITGQALFMRAYKYFDMVVYHGGVPYITTPQDRYEDDLMVSRNSTAECFDLIEQDLLDAIELLPQSIPASSDVYGKIDQNFALAFYAKVMLYKASPQFNPSNPWSNQYWETAYTVNKQAYDDLTAQGYGLIEDYADLFLDERNNETVFAVVNTYPNKTAAWDHGVRPGSESRGPASACPTWEFVQEFPMLDGKLYNDPTSDYFMTDEEFLQNFWENRDPRFNKSVVWNASVYEVSGKAGHRQYTSLGIAHELDDYGINPEANINSTNLNRYSGFFVKKASDLSLTQAEVQQYDVDYVVMRFAEVMLNYAEAANETGKSTEALEILKQLRERAGIEPGSGNNFGITATTTEEVREAIIAERNIEFCFEGHRFWDLRRLRMLDRLDGISKHGVEAIAINENGTEMAISTAKAQADANELLPSDFEYSLLITPYTGTQISSVPDTYYFFPISQSSIDANGNLEQNVDWGGSFNPTLE